MKTYVKPELFYEDLQLATSIASCTLNYNKTLTDPNKCFATYPGDDVKVFTAVGVCETTSADTDVYCVFNGSATSSTFNS